MSQNIWIAPENYFPELRKLVSAAGYYDRRPWIPVIHLIIFSTLLLGTIFLLPQFGTLGIIFAALACAFFSLQLGYVMHDSGHRQCFKSTALNNVLGFISTGLIGASFLLWMEEHNEHHDHPNYDDSDPDISIPFIAFSEGQADDTKSKLYLFFISIQIWFYLPILTLILYSKRYRGMQWLLRKEEKTPLVWLDFAINVFWHVVYYGGIAWLIGFWPMVLFATIHQGFMGFLFGMVFAPNHKGMPIIERGMELDFLTRQIITARNFHSTAFTDFLYGGLNYQIEHHLFPNMPRYNLRGAKQITEKFCREKEIPYHETSLIGSYKEIYLSLRNIGRHARKLGQSIATLQQQLQASIQRLKDDVQASPSQIPQEVLREDLHSLQQKLPEYYSLDTLKELPTRISTRLSEIEALLNEKKKLRKSKILELQKELRQLTTALKKRTRLVAA